MSEQHAYGVPTWDMADRLRKALEVAGMKPGDMADHLGVHRNTVGYYLARKTEPDKRTLMLWAMRTGVALEWIKSGESANPDGPNDGQSTRTTRWYVGLAA